MLMRALSWKEPFASLMLCGKIETRVWSTKYRGRVLICASKQPYSEAQICNIAGDHYLRIFDALKENGISIRNTCGLAIAVGELVDCRPMHQDDEDACFVKFFPDLYCHIYENVRAIRPFHWKGKQGWTTISPELEQLLIP